MKKKMSKSERERLAEWTRDGLAPLFEVAIDGGLISDETFKADKTDFPIGWFSGLVDRGFLKLDSSHPSWPAEDQPKFGKRKQFNYYKLTATEAGLQWWYRERGGSGEMPLILGYDLEPITDGKGIGAELQFSRYGIDFGDRLKYAFRGLALGYFEFVSRYSYRWAGEESMRVRLTKAGMEYFDSVPRLQLECA